MLPLPRVLAREGRELVVGWGVPVPPVSVVEVPAPLPLYRGVVARVRLVLVIPAVEAEVAVLRLAGASVRRKRRQACEVRGGSESGG